MADTRSLVRNALSELFSASGERYKNLINSHISEEAIFSVSCPVEQLKGRDQIGKKFFQAIKDSLSHAHRRDEIFIGGNNRRSVGGYWVASVTHYVGNFNKTLWGIDPSHHLVFLRSGEFYQIRDSKIIAAKIIVDLLDLLRQCGRFPLPGILGTEMLFPGPATHDGVLPSSPEQSESSLDIVEAMLGDLHLFDPETFTSAGQTGENGYWHDNMLWYGPGGIGSNFRWEGFHQDHRAPFLTAFPDRKGGNHYCRIGDGNYAAVSGWPSMTMTHRGDYLGVPATHRKLTLRVMDFYRCHSGKIAENWVCLDYMDLFRQMGVDLIGNVNRV